TGAERARRERHGGPGRVCRRGGNDDENKCCDQVPPHHTGTGSRARSGSGGSTVSPRRARRFRHHRRQKKSKRMTEMIRSGSQGTAQNVVERLVSTPASSSTSASSAFIGPSGG